MVDDNKKQTIGEFLKKEREAKKISLEKFSELSKISKKKLIDIENNKFSEISDIYLDLYLKKYAKILNLNYSDLQNKISKKFIKTSNDIAKHRYSIPKFIITPKILTSILITILFFGIIFYFIYQFKNLFGLPMLEINNPINDITIIQLDKMTIKGKTDADNILKINGKRTALQENGYFEEVVNIHEGLNIIKIEAVNIHGKINSITKMILRK